MANDESPAASRTAGGFLLAVLLFFLAPLVGEYLLGNLPVTWLWLLIVLAPLYGGGALLIRETARRLELGWPGIMLLGLAYAVIEEALVTQSLFNPNYVGQRLLEFGYMPALGMGSWWTVFVLSIHVIWSISTPIALAEAISGKRRHSPWLGKLGRAFVAALFVIACVVTGRQQSESFRASVSQLTISGLAVLLVVALAFVVGRKSRGAEGRVAARGVPRPILTAVCAFLLGSAFMLLAIAHTLMPPIVNVVAMLALIATGCLLLWRWARASAWSPEHELAVAAGFLATYAWYGFVQVPSVGQIPPLADAAGNLVFALGAVALIRIAYRRVTRPGSQ